MKYNLAVLEKGNESMSGTRCDDGADLQRELNEQVGDMPTLGIIDSEQSSVKLMVRGGVVLGFIEEIKEMSDEHLVLLVTAVNIHDDHKASGHLSRCVCCCRDHMLGLLNLRHQDETMITLNTIDDINSPLFIYIDGTLRYVANRIRFHDIAAEDFDDLVEPCQTMLRRFQSEPGLRELAMSIVGRVATAGNDTTH